MQLTQILFAIGLAATGINAEAQYVQPGYGGVQQPGYGGIPGRGGFGLGAQTRCAGQGFVTIDTTSGQETYQPCGVCTVCEPNPGNGGVICNYPGGNPAACTGQPGLAGRPGGYGYQQPGYQQPGYYKK
jgi:hypothetical protein